VLSLNVLVMCVICAHVYIVPLADIPAQSMVPIYRGRLRSSLLIFEHPDLFKVSHYSLIVIILGHLNKPHSFIFSASLSNLFLPKQRKVTICSVDVIVAFE